MNIHPLTQAIGAEISGIDLNQPLDSACQEQIYQALMQHQVIFFRAQTISPAAHLAFAQHFGELDAPHPLYANVEGYPNIVQLANDANNPPDTDGWHTDLSFKQAPPFASILVARSIPDNGGDTLWASQYAAYEALSDGMKQDLAGLQAVHDMGDFRNSFANPDGDPSELLAAYQRFGCSVHSVIKTHPVTGRQYLYVNEGFTQHILGLTAADSRRLLVYLLDHLKRPEFQVRFKWAQGAVAMWDNRCTQHYAVADYLPAYRCMHRVTLVNDQRESEMPTRFS